MVQHVMLVWQWSTLALSLSIAVATHFFFCAEGDNQAYLLFKIHSIWEQAYRSFVVYRKSMQPAKIIWFWRVLTSQSFHFHRRTSASNNEHFFYHAIADTPWLHHQEGSDSVLGIFCWWQTSVTSHSLVASVTQHPQELDSQTGRKHLTMFEKHLNT